MSQPTVVGHQLTNMFAGSMAPWIQMIFDQDSAVGTYVLPSGAEVRVTAPAAQHAPELHLTLPGQQPVRASGGGTLAWAAPFMWSGLPR
jgi:hypothetical protein